MHSELTTRHVVEGDVRQEGSGKQEILDEPDVVLVDPPVPRSRTGTVYSNKHVAESRVPSSSSSSPEAVYVSRCCHRDGDGKISKNLVQFLVTSCFTAVLLAFAMYKLSGSETTGEEKALYYSLLSSCLAVYLPAPTPHDTSSASTSAAAASASR